MNLTTRFSPENSELGKRISSVTDKSRKSNGIPIIVFFLLSCLVIGILFSCELVPAAVPEDTTSAEETTQEEQTEPDNDAETTVTEDNAPMGAPMTFQSIDEMKTYFETQNDGSRFCRDAENHLGLRELIGLPAGYSVQMIEYMPGENSYAIYYSRADSPASSIVFICQPELGEMTVNEIMEKEPSLFLTYERLAASENVRNLEKVETAHGYTCTYDTNSGTGLRLTYTENQVNGGETEVMTVEYDPNGGCTGGAYLSLCGAETYICDFHQDTTPLFSDRKLTDAPVGSSDVPKENPQVTAGPEDGTSSAGTDSYYRPDYQTENTLHADVFLEILNRDGYYRNGEIDRDYNTGAIRTVVNITPQSISDETSELEVFLVNDIHCFLMKNGTIYRYESFGGYHYQLCLWDYDGNGVKDLVSFDSYGSGIPYLGVGVLDLTTMKATNVISINLLKEKPFTFECRNGDIYIDGEKLTYHDGSFHCASFD